MKCCVLNCPNYQDPYKMPGVRFFCVPRNSPERRKKWLDFCKQPKVEELKRPIICSAHFKPEDFERNLRYEFGLSSRNPTKLLPEAVPSIYPNEKVAGKSKESYGLTSKQPIKLVPNTLLTIYPRGNNVEKSNYFSGLPSNQLTKQPPNAVLTIYPKEKAVEESKDRLGTPLRQPIKLLGKPVAINKVVEKSKNSYGVLSRQPIKLLPKLLPKPVPKTCSKEPIQEVVIEEDEKMEDNLDTDYGFDFADIIEEVDSEFEEENGETPVECDIKRLSEEVETLKTAATAYQTQISTLKMRLQKAEFERNNMHTRLATIFSENQVQLFKRGKISRVVWNQVDIDKARSLLTMSSRVYKCLIRNDWPLPSIRTLQRWAHAKPEDILQSDD